MMNPVPKGAIEPVLGDTTASGLPEAAASEDSVPPHADTKITALMKSMALEPPRLKMLRPTVGGFISLSAPNEKVHANDKAADHISRSSAISQGHLMYYVIEIIKGSPLSEKAMEIGQQLGIMLLFTLMAFAVYNDINRFISS